MKMNSLVIKKMIMSMIKSNQQLSSKQDF